MFPSMKLSLKPLIVAGSLFFVGAAAAQLPVNLFELTKLHDFTGTVGSPMRPWSFATQVDNSMWFTTNNGGDNGFGAVARWDLATNSLVTVFTAMNIPNGNTPQGGMARDGDFIYLTTTRGGTGDRGVLARLNMVDNTYEVLWNSPESSPATNPNTLVGNPEIIDRGTHKEIYFLTRNGGPGGSSHGTVQKYNTATNTVTLVGNLLGGATEGRQPLDGGFTRVGDALYFTTFTGGPAATNPNTPNGPGTLMRVNLSTDAVETVAIMPIIPGVGSTRLPATNPVYSAAHDALFFTTSGTSLDPGSVMKFDLTSDTLITLDMLQGAATSAGPFPEGRFAYGITVFGDDLFFTTTQGGDFNGGTLNRFNLLNNSLSVLQHLGNDTVNNIQWGSNTRGGPVVAQFNGQDYLFILTNRGGDFDQGTILVMAIPEPSSIMLIFAGAAALWLRRRIAER
jgi:uncharacterized repeat protein (TIGR03803 family)